ncbi:hypothetical protein MKW98_018325 [Papaver atlanticum]|uniref:ATP-dependent DNA helicase n=1 Tax=Papaver atlanticum TaxID=357466 RepID=A0AAD4T7C6_9MAGN|nr:hypothetical protein MKW98_018325 [Papaver atlanticum]
MAPNFRALEATDLGLRDIDRNHSWSRGLLDNPTIHKKIGFVNTLRQVVQDTHDSGSSTSLPALSRQQQAPHDLVLDSLRSNSTIRLIISGGAGTGKSTLINAIVRSTRELFNNENSVRIMVPTGVAAFNIGGSTIHQELGITADKSQSYKKLEAERCRRMQVDFKNTKLIIIDEYIMIGTKMLAYIDLRLRDIFGTKESFGNISIVLVGDMRQLPPVFDTPLYAEGGRELQLTGNLSYSEFKQCFRLEQVFRQSGVEELEYKEALSRLSDGKSPVAHWNLFATRSYATLSVEEIHSFRHALRLFPSKDEAASYNEERLRELGFPVAHVLSVNNCLTAEGASSDDAKGLQNILLLSKQARVMLRKNYSTQFGLVNGSTGTVKDIIYKEGDESPGNIPIAVLVEFDKYIGPRVYEESTVVPIIPVTTNWISSSGVPCHASGFNYHLSCVGQ